MSQQMKEVISKRTACMKVFENADHSFTAAIYGTPVHYMKNGRWEEIDNRLEAVEDALPTEDDEIQEEDVTAAAFQSADSENAEAAEDGETAVQDSDTENSDAADTGDSDGTGGDVANIAGNFQIRLSNKVKKKNMVRLGEGSRKFSWGFVNAHSVKRQILKETESVNAQTAAGSGINGTEAADNAENTDPTAAYAVSHLESRVLYPEAFDGVDIRYTIGPASLKEDLILKNAEAVKSFTWRYAPGELRARQDGADVVFEDAEGMEAYRLSAPYMEDAAGSMSRGLTLTLTDDGGKKNKEAYVTLEADSEWLEAEDRVYPVTIDPVASTPLEYDKIEDCHVSQENYGDNFYESFMLKTGRVDGSTLRSFIKFQLPVISRADHMITSASFFLTKYAGSGSAERRIDVHKVIQPWFHRSLTWANRPDYDVRISDFVVFNTNNMATGSFDITDIVRDWYMNGHNYGLMVKDHEEKGNYTEYLSADTNRGYIECRPKILIQYVSYAGLEDYWTYHSQSVGRAGTVYVNDACGNMIMVHDTFSLSGSRMPIDLKHVYNSSYVEKDMGYGKGFRLNYHQTIGTYTEGDVTYYEHIDGDGTSHYFVKNDKGEWKDELGMELTLEVKDIQEGAKYIITDKNNTQMIFGASGRLAKIIDANGNTLTIAYAGNPKKLDAVADGSGRKIKCSYDANGHLASVKAPSGQEKTFTYDSGGRLTKITDVDGVSSTYAYNDSHMMTTISDYSGYSLSCDYMRPFTNGAWRVTKLLEKAGTTEGMSLSMAYSYNCTRFTDEKGRSQYYMFDNSGHTVSVRDDNGYGAAWKYQSGKASRLSAASDLQFTPVQMLKGNFGGLTGWRHYTSADTVTVSEDTNVHYIGKKCIKMNGTGTDAYGTVVQNVSLKPGKRYVFSVYAKAEPTAVVAKSAVWLQAWKVDDTEIVRHIHPVKGKMDWTRIQMSFTAPAAEEGADNVTVKVYARSMYMKGNLWLDAFQLEEGEAASRFNLLVNNNFANGLYGFKKAGGAGDEDSVITVTGNGQDIRLAATITKSGSALYRYADSSGNKLMDLPVNTKAFVLGAGYDKAGTRYYLLNGTKDDKTFEGYTQMGNVTLSGRGAYAVVNARAADGTLNVRTGPGTSYTSLLQISEGTSLIITGAGKDSSGNKWYLCSFTENGKDYTGYIYAEYVTVTYYADSKGKAKAAVSVKKGPGSSYNQAIALAADAAFTVSGETVLADGTRWLYIKGKKGTTDYEGHLPASSVTITKKGDIKYVYVPPQTWRPASGSTLGDQVLRINGNEQDNKELVYTLDISGKKGDCYMASAWGQGKGVSLQGSDRKDRHFGICVAFTCTDGTVERHHVDFGADTERWQYLNEAVVAKKDYSKIQVMYCYHKNGYRSHFTGLSLFKEQYGTSFTYDENNNVVKVTDKSKKNSKFEYDAAGNIAKMIDVKGNSFKYTYDDKHNVTSAVSAMNVKYAFSYNSNGNIATAKIVNPSSTSKAITATAEYTKDGNYISKLCDEDGNSAAYRWDSTKGLMTSVIDGEGNETKYTYDNGSRVNKVSASTGSNAGNRQLAVTYTYKNDRMAQIKHNGFIYDILYDGFGKETAVKIAGVQVVGHTYNDKNGLLRQTDYANGVSVRYTYDSLDRLQKMEVLKNKVVAYSCKLFYDRHGQVSRKELGGDQACIWTYDYDLVGRLGRAISDSGEQRTYQYDENGNMSSMKRTCGGNTQTTSYTFDKDDREVTLKDNDAVISRTYDVYGRRSVSDRGNGAFKTTYKYAVNAKGQPVNRVESIENKGKTISYTYDSNGNVKTIHDEAGTTTYQYDALQRLLREDNVRLKKTIIYDRDAGGNVTQKKIYSFNTGDISSSQPEKTVIYTYADGWKDQMIMADGESLRYDESGNMTEYQGDKYSWCGNGILSDIQKADGSKIHYSTNADGVRIQKKLNGTVTTVYFVDGNLILGEKNPSGYQAYIYNSSGELEAVRYNKKVYYYIKNGQNDVIGLCDTSGQQVVDYCYDTWGNLLATGGSMADTLGKDNPFRYRGYYYDEETGLYYLNSRYYHPGLGRMISADCLSVLGMSKTTLNDKNLYNYCDGNPVGRLDESGRVPMAVLVQGAIGGVIGCVSGIMAAGAVAEIEGRKVTAKELGASAVSGFFSGAISGALSGFGLIGILTDTQVSRGAWLASIAVAGAVAYRSTDGSFQEKVDAALNDMVKAAVTGLAFGVSVPYLEDLGNTILSSALGVTYDMGVARANTARTQNTSTASSKGGYSGKRLIHTETTFHISGRTCFEISKSYYSDGSVSIDRKKYIV